MKAAKPVDIDNKAHQRQSQKQKQKEPVVVHQSEAEVAGTQMQRSGSPTVVTGSGNPNNNLVDRNGNNPMTQTIYDQGSEIMYGRFQESLKQTGDANHPDTKKAEKDYMSTKNVSQVQDYNDHKLGTSLPKTSQDETTKSKVENQEVMSELILQAGGDGGGKFRVPIVYRKDGYYIIDFHSNQTDYDGSIIKDENQFLRFITKVLNESDQVLPKDKPKSVTLEGNFEGIPKLLEKGGGIKHTPSKQEYKVDGKSAVQEGIMGNGNGTGKSKKSVEELEEEFDSFPQSVKKLIRESEKGNLITPEEKLALAQYIFDHLTVLEMLDYASKVSESAMSLEDFKTSIQQYKQNKTARETEQKQRNGLEKQLSTASFKELYKLYKDYAEWIRSSSRNTAITTTISTTSSNTQSNDMGIALASSIIMTDKEEILTTALERAGYKGGIAEFEKLIHDYEAAFEKEALHTAIEQLQKYKHILFEEKNKLENTAYLQQLLNQIKGTGAAHLYNTGKTEKASATKYRRNGEAFDVDVDYQKLERGQQKINKADSLVNTIPHDLVKEKQFDKAEFAATSDTTSLYKFLKEYIEEKQASISSIEDKITEDPEAIYGMGLLYNTCKQTQGIVKGSVLDEILTDKKTNIEELEFVKNIAIAFGAIVLTIASAGTGTLALVALGANFALSAYTIYETIETYKTEKDGYNAGVLSDDPSLLWVVLAIAGAVVDAAALRSAFKAAEPIAAATKAFNDAEDATRAIDKLKKDLAKIKGLDEKISRNIVKSAEAQAKYLQTLFKVMGKANSDVGVLALGYNIKLAYLSIRKGMISFEKFLLDLKAANLLKESQLTKEQITMLEKAFTHADELAKVKDEATLARIEEAFANDDYKAIEKIVNELEETKKTSKEVIAGDDLNKQKSLLDKSEKLPSKLVEGRNIYRGSQEEYMLAKKHMEKEIERKIDEISKLDISKSQQKKLIRSFQGRNKGYIEGYIDNMSFNKNSIRESGEIYRGEEIFKAYNVGRDGGINTAGAWSRSIDTEYVMLSEIAEKLGAKQGGKYTNIVGKIKIVSELPYCMSCQGVIQDFGNMFPEVEIILIDNIKY